jgi:hypothetical protein
MSDVFKEGYERTRVHEVAQGCGRGWREKKGARGQTRFVVRQNISETTSILPEKILSSEQEFHEQEFLKKKKKKNQHRISSFQYYS